MADFKSIFNRPKQNDPSKDPHLFDWKRPFHSKDDVRELNQLLKSSGKKKRTATLRFNKVNSGFTKTNGNPNNRKQRVMFKMTYGTNLTNHKKYIRLYMPQIGKEGVIENPNLFGCSYEEYEQHMSPRHFKCIISPESQNIDLKALTECFVRKMEKLTGYEFYWMGAIHTDTEHNHVHLAINGKDKNGKTVRFPKDFIKNEIRNMLSDMATDMIGERTYEEIQAAKSNQTRAKRWTTFDEQLKAFPDKIYIKQLNQSLTNRLQYLASIGLATKDGYLYSLNPDCEEVLKTTGRYNTYLEEYLKPDAHPLHLFKGGSITGTVDKVISFDRDESWNDAIILRMQNERVYIPVYQLKKLGLEGKTVRIEDAKGGLNRNVTDKDIKIVSQSRSLER